MRQRDRWKVRQEEEKEGWKAEKGRYGEGTRKEKKRGRWRGGERDSDRECQRQSRTDRWGEKAELKSVAPEQRRAEAKSHESRQIWNLGLSTRQRAGAVGTGYHDQ